MSRISINKLVASHPLPTTYVFMDTCAILDILRLPAKHKDSSARYLVEFKRLLQKIQNRDVVLVSSFMNYIEQQSNLKVARDTEKSWENGLSNNIEIFEEFAIEAGVISSRVISTPFSAISFKRVIEELYHTLTKNIFYLPEKLQYDKFAMERVKNKIPPAHKKNEYKDCFIWGTCLDLARHVKTSDKIVFYSTNTEDFTIEPRHPEALRFQRDASNVLVYTDFFQMMHNV